MAKINITNLTSGSLSLDLTLDDGNIIIRENLIQGETIDVGDRATIDDMNRSTEVQGLIANSRISVTYVGESSDTSYTDHSTKWAYRIPESCTVDSDVLNGSLIYSEANDLTSTNAAPAFMKSYDEGTTTFSNTAVTAASAPWTANWQFWPDVETDDDATYFGNALRFCQMYIDVDTAAAAYGGDAITWEYWDGSTWSALTIIYDHTGNTVTDGTRPYIQDGSISFIPPTDWVANAVDSQTAYWVRARISAFANLGVNSATINSVEHDVVTVAAGFKVPNKCVITELTVADEAATAHSTADIEFILFNFTKGTHTAVLTFAQDRRRETLTGLTLACDAGDNLSLLMTQEDGSAEMGPVTLEIGATLS